MEEEEEEEDRHNENNTLYYYLRVSVIWRFRRAADKRAPPGPRPRDFDARRFIPITSG